jgi:flagellin
MRDLSVQASNAGGINDDAKGNIQSEIGQLKQELNRIANTTTFNGKKLLDGSFNANFQVGANSGETISVSVGTAMGAAGLGVDGVDVTGAGKYSFATGTGTAAGKVYASGAIDGASGALTINPLNTNGFASGADFEALSGTIGFGGKSMDLGSIDWASAAGSDAVLTQAEAEAELNKVAKATFGLTGNSFVASNTSLVFGVKEAVSGYTEAAGAPVGSTAGTPTTAQLNAATPTFTGAGGAPDAIDKLDAAIKKVSTTRADLGAIQNRFDHTINNLNVAVENLTASESRIRDADMAQEMVQFTRNQILSQAGTAMLAQANQASQGVLSLLR